MLLDQSRDGWAEGFLLVGTNPNEEPEPGGQRLCV